MKYQEKLKKLIRKKPSRKAKLSGLEIYLRKSVLQEKKKCLLKKNTGFLVKLQNDLDEGKISSSVAKEKIQVFLESKIKNLRKISSSKTPKILPREDGKGSDLAISKGFVFSVIYKTELGNAEHEVLISQSTKTALKVVLIPKTKCTNTLPRTFEDMFGKELKEKLSLPGNKQYLFMQIFSLNFVSKKSLTEGLSIFLNLPENSLSDSFLEKLPLMNGISELKRTCLCLNALAFGGVKGLGKKNTELIKSSKIKSKLSQYEESLELIRNYFLRTALLCTQLIMLQKSFKARKEAKIFLSSQSMKGEQSMGKFRENSLGFSQKEEQDLAFTPFTEEVVKLVHAIRTKMSKSMPTRVRSFHYLCYVVKMVCGALELKEFGSIPLGLGLPESDNDFFITHTSFPDSKPPSKTEPMSTDFPIKDQTNIVAAGVAMEFWEKVLSKCFPKSRTDPDFTKKYKSCYCQQTHFASQETVFRQLNQIKKVCSQFLCFSDPQILLGPIPVLRLKFCEPKAVLEKCKQCPNCLYVDISSGHSPGHTRQQAFAFIEYFKLHFSLFEPVVIFLKHVLQAKKLNNPFTGGVSSFPLCCLVAAYFNSYRLSCRGDNLGKVIYGFLDFYGNRFSCATTGVDAIGTQHGKHKVEYFYPLGRYSERTAVYINSPFTPYRNIASSCFNIEKVMALFRKILAVVRNDLNLKARV
eukprot:snap_masked-scaffold_14-processed-gene-7.31-mRNA-1 protein AED:1.00 eAED:1.00 QI:0/0/0/0/1/1/2/0/693